MGLWGVTTAATDKPKFLPVDSNASGSTGAREHAIAVKGGWGLSPGLAASGNDNTDAQPTDDELNAAWTAWKNANEYKGKRQISYPSWKEQMDMQYWDAVNGTTTWKDAIAKIKSDNPKPS